MDKNVINIPDYYWRDYTGIIPRDAIQGGYDATFKHTYIGQAFFKDHGLLPGTIRSGCHSNLLTSARKELLIADCHIKVLCCRIPRNIKWIATNNKQFVDLTGHHFIVGGYLDTKTVIYIGRSLLQNQMLIGSMCVNKNFTHGLVIPCIKNNSQMLMPDFEILTYKI